MEGLPKQLKRCVAIKGSQLWSRGSHPALWSRRHADLEQQGLQSDLTTFNALLKAAMRCHSAPHAEQALAALRRAGLRVTRPTLSQLAGGAGRPAGDTHSRILEGARYFEACRYYA